MNKAVCPVCPRHCALGEGDTGACRARICRDGQVVAKNYGKITSLALDPIEKKPLAFYRSGSRILSVGSYGCMLSCPFCQNYEIAAAGEEDFEPLTVLTPEDLCRIAREARSRGNIGVAFTYNEPLTGCEYVRDTARLVKEAGMDNVLVTNGMAELPVLREILPYMDAMNIDLKTFRAENYERIGGRLETVMDFIRMAAGTCHVEITTLIVPGFSDDPEDMKREAAWIADISPEIPLHITRYFPRYKMKAPATDVRLMRKLAEIAGRKLHHVRLGNV